jgi:hypothetical protein
MGWLSLAEVLEHIERPPLRMWSREEVDREVRMSQRQAGPNLDFLTGSERLHVKRELRSLGKPEANPN